MGKLIPNPDNIDVIWDQLEVGDWAFIDSERAILVRLPGCDESHGDGVHLLPISRESRFVNEREVHWTWDGNHEAPTLTPSILCKLSGWHGYLTKGVLVEV